MLRVGATVVGTALLMTLLGCASTSPQSQPSSTPVVTAPVPSATPTPTPTAAAPTALVVNSTHMAIVDSDGETIAESAFSVEDPAAFAAALGDAFGAPAQAATLPGGAEGAEFTTTYTWDGITISSGYSPGQCDGTDCRGTYIHFTEPIFAGIALRTASGITVGDSVVTATELGARPTPEIPLAAEPEDPSLFDSTTEVTRVVILDLSDDESTIVGVRASGWFSTFGNI